MLHAPRLLLLDEPTVGADPQTRQALLNLVPRGRPGGAAVCYTTHYLPELVDLGATLAVCAAGRVIARGPARSPCSASPARRPAALVLPRRTDRALYSTADPPGRHSPGGSWPAAPDPSSVDIFAADIWTICTRALAVAPCVAALLIRHNFALLLPAALGIRRDQPDRHAPGVLITALRPIYTGRARHRRPAAGHHRDAGAVLACSGLSIGAPAS